MSEDVTSSFSEKRLEILETFSSLEEPFKKQDVEEAWSYYSEALKGSKGIFTINDPSGPVSQIPGNKDFDKQGFLRCWLSGDQFHITGTNRYGSTIACDTNFVSYCKTFVEGRDLRENTTAFREALLAVLPFSTLTTALPYMLENSEGDLDKVFLTLKAFNQCMCSSHQEFSRSGVLDGKESEAELSAKKQLDTMKTKPFKNLHGHMKERFIHARVILLKMALISLQKSRASTEKLFYEFCRFCHEELARIPQPETYMAYRFFSLNTAEPFFSPIQATASSLVAVQNNQGDSVPYG